MEVRKHYQSIGMTSKQARRFLEEENKKHGKTLKPFATPGHPNPNYIGAFRSCDFLVQVFRELYTIRLSINRTTLERGGEHWSADISWEELQRIKAECGYSDKCAVELFPPEDDVVNVANMRHLFILDTPPVFMWSKAA